MGLRLVGAGVGRTGTMSLKVALEKLLGAPCYHMAEVFQHPEHVAVWAAAARGEAVDWEQLFDGYAAAVDWPAGSFWPEIAQAFPDAPILLSTRSPESWWESASQTIFPGTKRGVGTPWYDMWQGIVESRFPCDTEDRASAIAAFERHNADVRARAPRARLLEWTAPEGWKPICQALGLPVPAEPFPRVNTRAQVLERSARIR